MIDDVKGYVVRGTWDTGPVVCHVPGGFWHDRSPHVFREIEYARSQRGLMLQQGCTDVSIFRVHADGREERLPSYEEALTELGRLRAVETVVIAACETFERFESGGERPSRGELGDMVSAMRASLGGQSAQAADPLAALAAAERRLLEAGGWTEEGPDKWSLEGVTWDRRDAVGIARYHAAKGGA